MRILYLVLVLAAVGLAFPASLGVSVLQPESDISLYNGSSFNVSLNVTCGDTDCDNVNVSLMETDAPISCLQILNDNPGADNGLYTVCPNGVDCINVYCDMDNGGWASIFEMESDLTLDSRDCIMHNNNDDMDSVIMWTDLSTKVMDDNGYATSGQDWFTWYRNGTENMVADYLPDRPVDIGSNAKPVPLPGSNKTVWFDFSSQKIAWDDTVVPFSAIGLDLSSGCGGDNPYFITDGIDMIHVGTVGSQTARLLTFNFQDNSVTNEDAVGFSPPNGWWYTEEDAFGNVLFTVNGRVMYFDHYSGSQGYFALGGGLDNPNSQYDTYGVPTWNSDSWEQPGLDFFARVDGDNYLWFGDWGHDSGGYFNCGDDEYLGVGKTNIMLTYNTAGIANAGLVPMTTGAHPFYTTNQNPRTVTLSAYESRIVNYSVVATTPGFFMFIGQANETASPFLNNLSEPWSVHTYNVAPPVPNPIAPADGFYMHSSDIDINFSCGNGIIDTIKLWTNTGGSWQAVYTNSSYSDGDVLKVNTGTLDNGNYTWAVWCNTTRGSSAWSRNQTIHVTDEGIFECTDFYDPGTYVLSMNVTAPYNSNCFNIYSDDVTLDCAGFSIRGDACNYGRTGVYSDGMNTTVKNCNIHDFDNGVYFDQGAEEAAPSEISATEYDGELLENGAIIHNNISNTNYGVYLDNSDYVSVLYNNFDNNDIGFYLWYADDNQIGRNNITSTSTSNFGGTSCPFLYTWNGTGYDFITDMSSDGKVGSTGRAARFKSTAPSDYSRIDGSQLQPSGGAYSVQVTEEYDEVSYLDELALMTIDHAPDVDVFTGIIKANQSTIYTVSKTPSAPLSCTDKMGNDCLSQIAHRDNIYTDAPVEGMSQSIVLDLGDLRDADNIKLLISYAKYPDLPSGAGKSKSIQVKDADGNWVEVYSDKDISSASLEKTYVADMTGKFPTDDYSVRLVFLSSIFDYVAVDTTPQEPVTVNRYYPTSADLHYRGYSAFTEKPILDFDYSTLVNLSLFQQSGNFTKYGDVLPLLSATDDMYVIMHNGDEVSLSFPYEPAQDGLQRDFLMYSYAYYKAAKGITGTTVEPLPFRGMSNYPYASDGQSYPEDAGHQEYLAEWNTRSYEPDQHSGGSLPYSFNNTVYENNIIGDQYSTGLYLEYEDETKLLDNYISGVEVGIDIYDSSNTNVTGNRVYSESGRALILHQGSSGSMVVDNTFHSDSSEDCNYDGCGAVYLGRTSGNEFAGNQMSAIDGTGLTVGYSNDNDFTDNSISSTGEENYAIHLWGSAAPVENLLAESEELEGPGNHFLHNTIVSDYWVYDQDGGNTYNDSDSGNTYSTSDGTPASYLFNITDNDSNGWADEGSDLPFGCDTVGYCGTGYSYWEGEGEDWHPYVSPPQDHGDESKTLSLDLSSTCDGNIVTVDGAGSDAHVVVKDSEGNILSSGGTSGDEFRFTGCDLEGLEIKATMSGYMPATLSGQDTVSCSECGNVTPGCTLDSDCPSNQRCASGQCVNVPCECGTVENRQCMPFACCSDSQCAAGELCLNHLCAKKPAYECTSDAQCAATEYCDIPAGAAGGSCKDVTGQCGKAQNHAFVPYGFECGTEPGCPTCPGGSSCISHGCISNNDLSCPTTGIVGDKKTCEAKETGQACANCDYVVTDPSGKNSTGRTDENGNFDLPLNMQGTYKVALLKNGAIVKVIEVKAFPQAQPQEPEKPTAAGPDAGMIFGLLVLLLLVVLGIVYWRSRGKNKKK